MSIKSLRDQPPIVYTSSETRATFESSSPICQYQIDSEILLQSLLSQTPPPYQLTLPLDDLLNSNLKPDGTVPRPSNSFILFRKDYNAKLKAQANLPSHQTSVLIGQTWNELPLSVLQFFEVLAMVSLRRHKIKWPNYTRSKKRKET